MNKAKAPFGFYFVLLATMAASVALAKIGNAQSEIPKAAPAQSSPGYGPEVMYEFTLAKGNQTIAKPTILGRSGSLTSVSIESPKRKVSISAKPFANRDNSISTSLTFKFDETTSTPGQPDQVSSLSVQVAYVSKSGSTVWLVIKPDHTSTVITALAELKVNDNDLVLAIKAVANGEWAGAPSPALNALHQYAYKVTFVRNGQVISGPLVRTLEAHEGTINFAGNSPEDAVIKVMPTLTENGTLDTVLNLSFTQHIKKEGQPDSTTTTSTTFMLQSLTNQPTWLIVTKDHKMSVVNSATALKTDKDDLVISISVEETKTG